MKTTCVVLLLVLFANSHSANAKDSESKNKWIQLFNGKDLDNWVVKIRHHELGENFNDTFRVEDNLLKVSYDKYDDFSETFGHIIYKKPFSNYLIRVEYRFVGKQVRNGPNWAFRNSGIMLHGQKPETMQKDQRFPVSIEVQLLGGSGSGKRTTANLCTPGTNVVMDGNLLTRHCTNSRSKTYHGDQWVTVEVEVRGGKTIKHKLNGKVVLEYTDPQLDPRDADAKRLIKNDKLIIDRGYISLQSESHPVEFRKVELLPLE